MTSAPASAAAETKNAPGRTFSRSPLRRAKPQAIAQEDGGRRVNISVSRVEQMPQLIAPRSPRQWIPWSFSLDVCCEVARYDESQSSRV